jgi:hypothetical protein
MRMSWECNFNQGQFFDKELASLVHHPRGPILKRENCFYTLCGFYSMVEITKYFVYGLMIWNDHSISFQRVFSQFLI